MLTHALDEIIAATSRLPDHLVVARRFYGHSPQQAVRALLQLQDALMEVDAALLGRRVHSHIDSPHPFAHLPLRLSRERPGFGLGAEGATAPETLRQTDREG